MSPERPIGERVASIETKLEVHAQEIASLRVTRHEHGNRLQALVTVPAIVSEFNEDLTALRPRVDATEKAVETMTTKVVPEIRKTLEQQANEIRKIREQAIGHRKDWGWIVRILGTAAAVVLAIAQGFILYLLTQ